MRQKLKQYSALIATGMSAGAMFSLPYMRDTYFVILRESLGFSNTEMGYLLSIYAFAFLIIGIPCGYLADRYSAKKLLVLCSALTGLGGIYYSSLPSLFMCMGIFCIWSFTTTMYWPVMAKVARIADAGDSSGKSVGIIESTRAMTYAGMGFLSIPLFTWLGSDTAGVQGVIMMYSVLLVAIALFCFFIMDEDDKVTENIPSMADSAKNLFTMLRNPVIWLLGGTVFATLSIYICSGMIVPYFQEVFGLSPEKAAFFGVIRASILASIAGITGGIFAKKLGSITKLITLAYLGAMVGGIILIMIPGETQYVYLLIAISIAMIFSIVTNKTMYLAPMNEIGIADKDTGMAAIAVTTIGFSCELFMYSLVGSFVDKAPGVEGYLHVFYLMVGMTFLGLICISGVRKIIAKRTEEQNLATA